MSEASEVLEKELERNDLKDYITGPYEKSSGREQYYTAFMSQDLHRGFRFEEGEKVKLRRVGLYEDSYWVLNKL